MVSIKERLDEIKKELPSTTKLIAVSKFHPAEMIQEAYDAGHRLFGESRVQELVEKEPLLPKDIEWHLIGTLQRNKVKYIIPFVHTIHSVDSVRLLQEIEKQCVRLGREKVRVLLQLHISGEETKFGLDRDELSDVLCTDLKTHYPHVEIVGLMGMASLTDDNSVVEGEFARMQAVFEEIKVEKLPALEGFSELSIGMSGDYKIAIKYGATYVRIGTAIFGKRSY